MDPKENAARKAIDLVRDGMVIGLGTGSTAWRFIEALAAQVKKGLSVEGIPSSKETERLARSLGITLVSLDEKPETDLTVDGADEVDPEFNLIKGRGGAFVREKILASASKVMAVIVDSSKLKDRLGTDAPVPVEVVPYGAGTTRRRLEELGARVTSRKGKDGPFVSDNGNRILDARFERIEDAGLLEREINSIPGVVDNGIFTGLADIVVVGTEDGATIRRKENGPIG